MLRKQFFAIFSENTAFFEKTVEYKNIQHLISDKSGYIFGARWPLTGRTATERPCCEHSEEAPFNPYFYIPKIPLLAHFLRRKIFRTVDSGEARHRLGREPGILLQSMKQPRLL